MSKINKSKVFVVMILCLAILSSTIASAQTATTTASQLQELINKLQAQIKTLQDQMAQITSQRQQVAQTVVEIATTLKEGDKGENVKILQALLAADSNIYPEGLITGFYGPLTTKAIKKFQKKHDLKMVGFVGPLTRAKLKELLKENPLVIEEGDNENEGDNDKKNHEDKKWKKQNKLCIPPGHLIAPGWLRKNGDTIQIIPICSRILPSGIAKKLATSTPDAIAPIISIINVVAGTTSSIVSWTTDEAADSQIYYGTSTVYGLSTVLDSSSTTSHSQSLTNLNASATYYYQIRSRDAANNLGTAQGSFQTLAIADTTAPMISNVSTTNIASSTATVNWTTDEPATSKVYYSTSTPINFGTALTVSTSSLTTSHSLNLSDLTASSTYQFAIESKDASNNAATSTQQSLITLP